MSADCISAIANVLMASAAVAGAVAAFMGLNTWKNQSLWNADTDLAKRALLAVYSFRDSLYSVRHPAMAHSEMELSEEEKEKIVAGSDRSAGVINAYAKRWDAHSQTSRALDAIMSEADVVWGPDLRDLVQPLKELERELYGYIMLHIDAHLRGGNEELAKSYREILKGKRDILYDLLDPQNDEFRADFEQGIGPVEDMLKKKLGRKR